MGALITEVIHDGDDNPIDGGVYQWDTSGTGVGPNFPVALMHVLYSSSPSTISSGAVGQLLSDDLGRIVLGASSLAIGKLASNSGVDIGDVDVLTVIPGTGATQLGKAIGNASGATDTGIGVWAIRDDALSALTDAEGDYVPYRVNANGALWVAAVAGAAQYVDDADWTDSTSEHILVGGLYQSSPQAITSGDVGPFQVDVHGNMKVANSYDEWETVAASVSAQTLGATGAAGDHLAGVLVVPATTSPGNVIVLDNATSITVFTGGASSVSTLHPFYVPLGMKSVSGAWKLTTGSNVSCIAMGDFT